MKKLLLFSFITILLTGCTVSSQKYSKYRFSEFERTKYLGKWYEIARKDTWFEKDLNNVTAEYSIKKNGIISVKNSGFNYKTQKYETALGIAKPDKNIENFLHVSFFRPFYADYIVLDYDRVNYSYALVRSKKTDFLWILARKPILDKAIIESLLQKAENDGIPTKDVILVDQNKNIENP